MTQEAENQFTGRAEGLHLHIIGMQDTDACKAVGQRLNAKGLLRERSEQLRKEAQRLEILAQSLPEVMSVEADAALFDLICRVRS